MYLLFVSTGLTVCYSFRLFYFVLCGNFNFAPSYSLVETSYNMMFGITGLLTISIFGGGSLIWLICPTPDVICLHYYLKSLLCLWFLWVVELFMRWLNLSLVIAYFLCVYVLLLHSLVLCDLCPFSLRMVFVLVPWRTAAR